MNIEEVIISASVTILSIGLLAVSLASYRKYLNPKLAFISGVFFVFLIKGILYTLAVFQPDFIVIREFIFSIYNGVFDAVMLVLLFIATIKR